MIYHFFAEKLPGISPLNSEYMPKDVFVHFLGKHVFLNASIIKFWFAFWEFWLSGNTWRTRLREMFVYLCKYFAGRSSSGCQLFFHSIRLVLTVIWYMFVHERCLYLLMQPFWIYVYLSNSIAAGWGCRIGRLHLCRRVRPLPQRVSLVWH